MYVPVSRVAYLWHVGLVLDKEVRILYCDEVEKARSDGRGLEEALELGRFGGVPETPDDADGAFVWAWFPFSCQCPSGDAWPIRCPHIIAASPASRMWPFDSGGSPI